MSTPSQLEKLLAELNDPDRRKRFGAIRILTHGHQRPDLATVDALIEIGHQLGRLADAYELVHAVDERRAGALAARERIRQEEFAKLPPPPKPAPPPRPKPALLKQYEYEENSLHLSVRTYNLLTDDGKIPISKEELLHFHPRAKPGFGVVAFAELVAGLVCHAPTRVPMSVIRASELWTSAPDKMREFAEIYIERIKQEQRAARDEKAREENAQQKFPEIQ